MSKSTRADGSNTRQLSGSTYRAEKDLSDSAAIALGFGLYIRNALLRLDLRLHALFAKQGL